MNITPYRAWWASYFNRPIYTSNGHDLRFFENPHPNTLTNGEGDKASIRARVDYIF